MAEKVVAAISTSAVEVDIHIPPFQGETRDATAHPGAASRPSGGWTVLMLMLVAAVSDGMLMVRALRAEKSLNESS
jgi:hypothetical protein